MSEATFMLFSLGDIVTWKSTSNGSSKVKTGEVVAMVAPNENPQRAIRESTVCQSENLQLKGAGLFGRNHQSYIVKVGRKLYWPRVTHLKRKLKDDDDY